MNNNLTASTIVVDLDGTLIKTDLLFESAWKLIKVNPLNIFLLFFWLTKGKSFLKYKIAEKIDIEVERLPYNKDLLDYLNKEKKEKSIILASASNQKYVSQISNFLGIFDTYLASSKENNLSKKSKADEINRLLGSNNYIYAGNSMDDYFVWHECKKAILVDASSKIKRKLMLENIDVISEYNNQKMKFKTWLKCLRIHQWVKNFLIFVPLLLSQKFFNLNYITDSLFAFIIFSLCASSVYVLNDLLDIEDDRRHRSKKFRPIPSGNISIAYATFLFPLLLASSIIVSITTMSKEFNLILLAYYLLTLLYSFKLKKIIMLDVQVLASLYTIRIIAGTSAIEENFSFWLLTFSIFMFLSLAVIKRFTEILVQIETKIETTNSRGYLSSDGNLLLSLGISSGIVAILVFALFINDIQDIQKYNSPEILWFMIPVLLYWISYVWVETYRGNMKDDPISFAIKDKKSLFTLSISFIIIIAAISL